MEFKTIPSAVKSVQFEDRTVTGITAVMGNIDDGGDRIFNGAFSKTLQERSARVQHLWQHDASQPPTAVIIDMHEVGVADLPMELLNAFPQSTGGLQVTRKYLTTQRGDEILKGLMEGAIKEMSFGYDAVKYDFEEVQTDKGRMMIRNLRELRLWDTSDVNWGMNPATVAAKALDDPLFAHHDDGGSVNAVKVRAAMATLLSGKKTFDNEAERRAVYNHLVEHLVAFKDEPLSYSLVEMAQVISGVNPADLKAGRVLSANNLNRLKEALQTLQEILAAAEPQDDGKSALTAGVLRRLAIAQHDPFFS